MFVVENVIKLRLIFLMKNGINTTKERLSMFEYLKRKFSKPHPVKIETYPKYYEENGLLIRENQDGARYVVTIDKKGNETIVRGYDG